MRQCVIDASVIVKWVLPGNKHEKNVEQALALLNVVQNNDVKLIQPPHWLAEVAAVVSRLAPEQAVAIVDLLYGADFSIADDLVTYHLACSLSAEFNHHVFDTLYHAVALNHQETTLITADERYYKLAHVKGSIMLLKDSLIGIH